MVSTVILGIVILVALIYAIVIIVKGAQQKNKKQVIQTILITQVFLVLMCFILIRFITAM